MLSVILDEISDRLRNQDFRSYNYFRPQLTESDLKVIATNLLRDNCPEIVEHLQLPYDIDNHLVRKIFMYGAEKSFDFLPLTDEMIDNNLLECCPENRNLIQKILNRGINNHRFRYLCNRGLTDLALQYVDDPNVTGLPHPSDLFHLLESGSNLELIDKLLANPKFRLTREYILTVAVQFGNVGAVERYWVPNFDFDQLLELDPDEATILYLIGDRKDIYFPSVILNRLPEYHTDTVLEIISRSCNDLSEIAESDEWIHEPEVFRFLIPHMKLNSRLRLIFEFAISIADHKTIRTMLRQYPVFTFLWSQVPDLVTSYLGLDSYLLDGIPENSLQWKIVQSTLKNSDS